MTVVWSETTVKGPLTRYSRSGVMEKFWRSRRSSSPPQASLWPCVSNTSSTCARPKGWNTFNTASRKVFPQSIRVWYHRPDNHTRIMRDTLLRLSGCPKPLPISLQRLDIGWRGPHQLPGLRLLTRSWTLAPSGIGTSRIDLGGCNRC